MRAIPTNSRSMPFSIAILLAVAMLGAQWIGLAHSVAHAGLPQQSPYLSSQASASADSGKDRYSAHFCVLFDAAALGAALNTPPVAVAIQPGAEVLALWLAFASWDAPFVRHFSSRAPPLA